MNKTHSETFQGGSRLHDLVGNQDDDSYLVINKDQDMIDKKAYKGDDSKARGHPSEGYGIDQYEQNAAELNTMQ